MSVIAELYANHPLWAWLALGGALLAVEVATGSGWLLWPAACAAAVALLTLLPVEIGFWGETAIFAVLTIITTFLAKKFTPSWTKPTGKDINDRAGDLIGKVGEAVSAFSGGKGRVLVDGAEWHAEIDDGADVGLGSKVKVVHVIDGGHIKVRPV